MPGHADCPEEFQTVYPTTKSPTAVCAMSITRYEEKTAAGGAKMILLRHQREAISEATDLYNFAVSAYMVYTRNTTQVRQRIETFHSAIIFNTVVIFMFC